MGWFYGFKLHMIINMQGDIIAVRITSGNVDDRKVFEDMVNSHNLRTSQVKLCNFLRMILENARAKNAFSEEVVRLSHKLGRV